MKTVCNVLLVPAVVVTVALWLCPSPVVADMTTPDLANGGDSGWSTSCAANALDVFGGLVADGTSYLPGSDGSELVVRTGLVDANPVSSTLTQHPNSEPVTIALMGIGLGAVFVRRKKLRQG